MFEAHVLHLLRRYLGEYVHGLSAEALRISVWKGDVVLKDLKLKAEALNSLKLPVTVKSGFVGTVTLKVPWKRLGKEPVIVLVDRVFLLAHPAPDGRSVKEEDREKLFEVKLQQIEEAEAATLEAVSKSKLGNQAAGSSWLGSLIATVIGNLKISISNVHIRYEDSVSNPGNPFACGITLAKLAAVTMDEKGNETFDTSGALDKLRKSLQLERLAMYHDSNRSPWKLKKNWEDLSPKEWVEVFEDGINESSKGNAVVSTWAKDRTYVVSPINGVLKYHRLGNQERNNPDVAFENASLTVSDVSVTITEAQYHDWIRLMEVISRYKTYVDIFHLRPAVPVSEGPALWWRFAAQASLQQKKLCYRFSWDQIKLMCHLRRRYIQLYAASLQQMSNVDNSQIRNIEKDLDPKVILLWRFLAHAKVESVKSKEAAEQRMLQKSSWFSFRWSTPEEDTLTEDNSDGPELMEEKLTKEEWHAINNLLSYQPDEDSTVTSGKDMQNMILYMINVSIGQASARIINFTRTEIVSGRFEQLHVSTKFKQRSTHYDVKLKFYGFSVPEGSLAQSVSSEQKENALAASFVQSPIGEKNLDWSLSATTSPCHVTVFMESYNRVLEFMKRSNAVSPTVALETATALQNKIEKVTRKAQEQFQQVLEEQSRFALDIDLDAPKVRVPLRRDNSAICDSHFLLDLGHFTLQTKEDQQGDLGQSLYSRFYISVKDIAALFTDCGSQSQSCILASATYHSQPPVPPILEDSKNLYSLIDRCGMAVIIDRIKIPCPRHPSTRVSVQVPTLGIHFSNARYCRLMDLINILCGTMHKDSQPVVDEPLPLLVPWLPADHSSEARVLVWKGIGYTVAAWQPCFLVLSGLHLYVLESEASYSYQRCSRMAGKQVFEVPPTNVGGSPHCIAVSVRGMDYQKALESFSTLLLKFRDEEEKGTWLRRLMQATYKASAPSSVDILGEPSDDVGEFAGARAMNMLAADLFVSGTLVEMKLLLYGKVEDELHEELEETLLIELIASGGKVRVVSSEGDLTVKVKLHSLKIKDELQRTLSLKPQYLACSVLKNEHSSASDSTASRLGEEFEAVATEEDDIFEEALPDFMSLPDSTDPQSLESDLGTGRSITGDVFYEAQDTNDSDFVSLSYVTRASSSPDYDGIDTQMSIRMSKLEFFCNRPTLVALIGFGLNLGPGNSDLPNGNSELPDTDVRKSLSEGSPLIKENVEVHEQAIVSGLLGYGKRRITFNLNMNFDSVTIFLNKEDGSQLAMFVQERFVLDLKVHPSSISIEGTLGNMRLCDLSLGAEHRWGWLCDIRNQGSESLIQFKFNSYSAQDDDYEGYDYSLHGRLSAVRIVFLYKFVQEISTYFMGLAAPHTEEAVKFVDKVGGIEWLIEKYEVDGASALKLDLALDTPIIIVPLNSTSNDFMQLDLGYLRVTNEVSWHGSPDTDPSAVHLDVLDAEIIGMNLAVGINGSLGKPIVRENENIHVYVRRSLRDVFRKIPTFQLEVKVGLLHAVMSDKEYNIILNSVVTNLNEPPNLPPNFRGSKPGSKDTIKLLADKVNLNSQVFLSRTVTIMAVDINYALLELCNGVHEESLLARLVLEGLWVSYRMTSLSEADLYVTIPRFSIVDIRPGTKPEMHLMLGSCTDVPKQDKGGFIKTDSGSTSGRDTTSSTMFLMDYRWRSTSQSWVLRLQQPRVLVVPDFLLAVGEFFVPSLGAITGREEMMDPKNDPIGRNNCVVLSAPLYKQEEDVIKLSPVRQLVADALGIDEYTYDGCGKTICLSEEKEAKEGDSFQFQPIIIIGRAKKLRFVNVKIENGSLLRKYTYLSNDSSYSVSVDDGVEIVLLDESHDSGDGKNADYMEEVIGTLDSTDEIQNDPGQMQAFNFEAQVISPEFTFYDSSKSSLDDSSQGEKLLRVKTDFGFMYASKENDTWVRAHLKDLSVEADSGLIILDPVDISGGYASVKDKINMSLTSTDIYVRLSLSVISLFLNLQSQATEAFQFGDADFLSPCTNFDRLWVSPKESGHLNNLTFWRPRAASKYVILGDCVTSRPIPPSIAVMAVSSAYGRVRKPLGFKFIGLFSDIQGNGVRGGSDTDCSIWLPVAPPGYLALGCVAHIGTQPPPNHVVHCIRSDLVTSTTHSECIFSASFNPSLQSGFTVWRLDNFLGSFYAHPSAGPPPRESCFDLNHLVLWNSSQLLSSAKDPSSDLTADLESAYQQRGDQGATSSGWDILRSVTKATSCYMSTPNFERIWWDRGGDLRRPVSIWRPISRPGFAILGDCITEGVEPPALGIIFKCDNPEISARPVQFTRVAHIVRKGLDEAFFWFPIAPPGYAPMGCVVTRVDEPPHRNSICCPRMDLVNQANIIDIPISRSSSSKSSQCWSLWRVENQGCTFLARSDLKKPSSRLAYTIGDSVKPKTRDNVTVDMKLRCISVTILDSLCGMMTPLFDATITNLKLATHGRLDDMNAVLIASVAASTFNTQLEAWEPLVEPFDGIFKFETYDTSGHPPARLVKRARIAVTSIMNMNISAANLDCFAETIISWRRHIELEQKATILNEDESTLRECGDSSTLSALDEDDSQMVILENKLGCDIYVKIVEQNSNKVGLVHHNDSSSLRIPPPRYSDRLNVADASREARHYVGVQIFEARELSITNDGNSHDFFCALRLLVNSQQANQQKLFPQSARTKCVRPLISKVNDREKGSARWNELFIFEVPHKGLAKLEVEVTNLGAKAGKGEVVGACSFMVGHGENTLKKVASIRMLHQASDTRGIITYPLKGVNKDDENPRGCLVASTSYFERKTVANFQSDAEDEHDIERDLGFWIGLSPEGAWEGFRSFLPLSVITKTLRDDFIAMEVVMRNGKKHAILRGLATVTNDSDVKLDISICPGSMSQSSGSSSERGDRKTVIEEVFENQRFQMGNKRTAFRGNDPGRWSTRDYSYSSKDFFEPPLASGWTWASSWIIDKSELVDSDGWAYGPDYLSLKWPLTSTKSGIKSAADAVRRRRWIRTRQQVIDLSDVNNVADALTPGSSATLPWKSMSKESDNILQVRPCRGESNQSYNWGRPVTLFPYAFGKDQPLSSPDSSSLSRQSTFKISNRVPEEASLSRQSTLKQANKTQVSSFKLNQLEKSDMLLCCSSSGSKQFWLSISTDASALHTELNAPVYDWKLSVNSPLKLENRLPCPAEFKIWERTKEGNGVERESGVISSRGTMHVYSADIRNPLYLTLRVQGCWVLEKDHPVLILDLSSNNHLSSFWMVHQQRRRRLRVSLEHDMGGTMGAPKTIRFFVPYWINNDCSLSLAYRVVEIESSSEGSDAKSAKIARVPPSPGRNVQILESIEDTSPIPSMFSPQEYVGRGGVNLFSSRNDAYLSPRVGIAVAVRNSDNYSTGVSLLELERKQRVDVKACTSDGYYYKLSALLNMTSDRTKVIHFQPQTLFVNRVGCTLCLQQFDTNLLEKIHPSDPPKYFRWQSSKFELLKVRVDGYRWSKPFSLGTEGVMCIFLRNETTDALMHLRVEVRGGTRSSRYEVIFRPISYSSPYRIENRSMLLPVHFRQIDGAHDSWKSLLPNASASFMWEDLGRKRVLEILVDGTDPQKSLKYDIDEINDHLPTYTAGGPPARALRVTVLKEEKVNVVKITDWMPENEPPTIRRLPSSASEISVNDSQIQHHHQQQPSTSNCEFHVIIEIAELGISVIDHTPEEILYLSVQSLLLSSSTGLGSGISRFKFRMRGFQVDNQLPLTPMPVLFRPQRIGEESDYILKLSVTQQSNGSVDLCVYPYIGIQGPENSAFLINVHEPIIWRIHGMMQHANLGRLSSDTQTDVAVSVDPIIQISVLNISEIRFKFSMAMSPTQRPVGVLGFWSSLMTALGNTENMPIRINQRFQERVSMRQSVLTSNAISNIKKDLLSQPLQLLSGVDILGNASSALGHMSKGVAALSMDKKFIQSRQRQENKGVEDFGDVIREGGGALAKGLFRGVTGILTKPLEGAKASGVEGFVQGVGKGIIGAAAQPVSGVLDLLSKTTEGANAMRMKIAAAIASEDQLLRRRLPRVIGGDNLLRPYDSYSAEGQVILQLAETGSFVDLFKVRGKFALSDAYEDHFLLPKGRVLVVTHRRILLLQQPSNIIGQKKFNPARDPCSVTWDVLWDDLVTMEFSHGKKDRPNAPYSKLILYLKTRSFEGKDHTRVIKCACDSNQAVEVYSSIEQAMNTYGPRKPKGGLKRNVTKPYSAILEAGSSPDANPRDGLTNWSPQQQMAGSTSPDSTISSNP